MKVAIIGGGICGLTLGQLFAKQGFDFQIFEQSQPPLGEGAGIILGVRALDVYRELGLISDLSKLGNYLKTVGLKKSTGETLSVANMRTVKERFGISNLGIHRQDLLKVL